MLKGIYWIFISALLFFMVRVAAFLVSQSSLASNNPDGTGIILLPLVIGSWLLVPVMAPVALACSLFDLIKGPNRLAAIVILFLSMILTVAVLIGSYFDFSHITVYPSFGEYITIFFSEYGWPGSILAMLLSK
jgi:heme/copper-type cytochrome/quinol oxidase subunit 3